jgi:CTP:molybdopterin cytidylyltransferase MocA
MNGGADNIVGLPVIVLGAGRGRRMGGPKALMMIEGRPWWAVQDERLRGYGLVPTWVVSQVVAEVLGGEKRRSDGATKRRRGEKKASGIRVQASGEARDGVVVADETAPMFASVLAGLASVDDLARGVFVLPVDTPAPRVEHWVRLATSAKPAHPTHKSKGGHPLYLPGDWIERKLGALVAKARSEGMEAVRDVAHTLRLDRLIEGESERIEVDDPSVVVNMNEPADVAAWLREQQRLQ